MLSRIAEALYWTGRYAERAEDTARLLDVSSRASLEHGDGPTSADGLDAMGGRETLAAVLGGPPVDGNRSEVLRHYCLDRASPESLAWCVRQARENARTVRDAVTSEVWEALNTWHLQVGATGAAELSGRGGASFLSAMRTRSYLVAGAAEATMLRAEGWQWLMLGRWLERLTFTCRVLSVRAPELLPGEYERSAAASYNWTVLLRSLSAYEAYRSVYRSGVAPHRVAEFLLLDPDFPRSARHSAMRVAEAVHLAVDLRPGASAPRLSGRLRGELDYRQLEEVMAEGVGPFVGRITALAAEVHHALAEESFARGLLPAVGLQPAASLEVAALQIGAP